MRPKVLFTTPVLAHPPAGGPQLRIENSIKALDRVCELSLLYRCEESCDLDSSAIGFYRARCREFVVQEYFGLSPHARLRRLQRLLRLDAGPQADFLLQCVDRTGSRVVWFGYGNISWPVIERVRQLRPQLKLVCDTDSVYSRYVLRELPFAQGERRGKIERAGRAKEREERRFVDVCDVTTAVSDVDAAYYRSIASDPGRVHRFSNGIDTETYRERAAPPAGFRRPALYLAGTFARHYSPMNDAARWLIGEVLPLVRQRVPEAHLYLVGNGSDRFFGRLGDAGITATGRLPSVLPYLCSADIALVPLKFESGTRFKILEAAACGIPVVSTTLGAEGLPVADGEHLLIADDAKSFAAAILRLLAERDTARRLAAACRDLVLRRFCIAALEEEARGILSYLGTA